MFHHYGKVIYFSHLSLHAPTRLQVIRPENSINWTLQIKYPQVRDSGVYECQINTEPKMSLSYELNVIGEYTALG